MDMEADTGEDYQMIMMHVPTMDVAHWTGTIIRRIIQAHTTGNTNYIAHIIAKLLRRKRGDTLVDVRGATPNNRVTALVSQTPPTAIRERVQCGIRVTNRRRSLG